MIKKFLATHNNISKYKIPILIAIIFCLAIIGVVFNAIKTNTDFDDPPERSEKETNSLINTADHQVIEMRVTGKGYFPNHLTAKPDKPIILRLLSDKAWGCASIVMIPNLKLRKDLPINGRTDLEIPSQSPGTTLNGTCIMGMYNFSIKIE